MEKEGERKERIGRAMECSGAHAEQSLTDE
jgi:hypothetical protein